MYFLPFIFSSLFEDWKLSLHVQSIWVIGLNFSLKYPQISLPFLCTIQSLQRRLLQQELGVGEWAGEGVEPGFHWHRGLRVLLFSMQPYLSLHFSPASCPSLYCVWCPRFQSGSSPPVNKLPVSRWGEVVTEWRKAWDRGICSSPLYGVGEGTSGSKYRIPANPDFQPLFFHDDQCLHGLSLPRDLLLPISCSSGSPKSVTTLLFSHY